MRVYLTSTELKTDAGSELLELAMRIALDGKLDLDEIKELRRWLRKQAGNNSVAAIGYLHDIMTRITADRVIDRDELIELHLAIERVIPAAHRTPIVQARKKRDAVRRERLREKRRRELEREAKKRRQLFHTFTKVAGVTFPNQDGSERQPIIANCQAGEELMLRPDPMNTYSDYALKVLRRDETQIGYVPEYLVNRIWEAVEDNYTVTASITEVTGGTWDKPTRGVNIALFFIAADIEPAEFFSYREQVLNEKTF